jgi:hypothetical protein
MANWSIKDNIVELGSDEGRSNALVIAQDLQQSLETLAECGDAGEKKAALFLLGRVNEGIASLLGAKR